MAVQRHLHDAGGGDSGRALRRWRRRLDRARRHPERDTLAGEQHLDGLADDLRAILLAAAQRSVRHSYRSPRHDRAVALPGGEVLRTIYERTSRPRVLEARCARAHRCPAGWQADHVLFNSGLAALSALFHALARSATGGRPRRLGFHGGYFETRRLLQLLSGFGLTHTRFADGASLLQGLAGENFDALLVEPVSYDWSLEVIDLRGFLERWGRRPTRHPGLLAFDTTLTGDAFPVRGLLRALRPPPAAVVEVRSGTKLDQQGLELASVGVLSVFTPPGAARPAPRIGSALRALRTLLGTTLTLEAHAALDLPLFLAAPGRHASDVFARNAELARAVAAAVPGADVESGPSGTPAGVFAGLAHPALGARSADPWARAPFVFLPLAGGDREHGRGGEPDGAARRAEETLLRRVIRHEARRRGLCLMPGTSFGFRSHRYEILHPEAELHPAGERRALLKIALGSRRGPSARGVAELVAELARHLSFETLAAAYPSLVPARNASERTSPAP